jgi:uncharacterized protein YdeI (YjbR/CyaY-like superfamily)
MIHTIENYLRSGCGRCKFFDTPQCKVFSWQNELKLLRMLIGECKELKEEIKWGVPCYSYNKKNVLVLAAFKDYCSLSFFKGALLSDSENLLVSPGENSQAVKQIKLKSIQEVQDHREKIKSYIHEAIELEKQGAQITFKKPDEYPIPDEFQARIDADPALKEAFYRLTPGRRRSYLLHFGQAKQQVTRESRISKYIPKILMGKGMDD